MPEKSRSSQLALIAAVTVLLLSLLALVWLATPEKPITPASSEPPHIAASTQPQPADRAAAKARVEEKLKRALDPKTASDPESLKFFQPPRSRTRPDLAGRMRPVTPAADGEPAELVMDYLQSAAPDAPMAAGWEPTDFSTPVILSQVQSRHNGVTHLYLRQQVDGIEVYNGDLNANVGKDGSILSLNNGFVKEVERQINRRQPVLTAAEAIERAAKAVRARVAISPEQLIQVKAPEGPANETAFDGGALSFDPIPAKLVYVAQPEEQTRLAWNLVLHLTDSTRWLDLTIDAENGELLTKANWYASADYEVFALPKEHPNDGPRTVETDPHDITSSPFGWHDTNGAAGAEFNTTQGNNVSAQEDTDANNTGGRRPNGGGGLSFKYPLNLATQAPADYENAAITNLYYWNNVIHDILWHYGFDEASGNFQENNYGNGGTGGDPVQADAQDGSGTNNANFGTPPDGSDPRMQMFVWTQANPDRDSDLDNGIIIHEYGHGISNRLTGGAANSSALSQSQSRGMGEGWSDWWGLCLTSVASDTATTPRGIGTYVLDQPVTGPGIRPYRYSTDMVENPQTYGDLNDGGLSVPHGIGSVWCTILWGVYWDLVAVHGWDPDFATGTGGNNIAMQLVLDGMKLQPANPTYLAARDAIILADQVNNGGANFDLLWLAFARRGLGFSATDGGGASSLNVTEAFDVPDEGISVTDVSVAEGNGGTVNAVFTVSLDMASDDEEIRVNYATENSSAIAPGDFTATSGQLIYPAGTSERTVTVTVNGDTAPEEDETFNLRLSNPVNAYLADDVGVGTILNDDYIPPVITSALTANGAEGIAFSYTIEAANTPRSFSIGGSVPAGLSVDPATGVISWAAPVFGIHSITITATNPAGSDTEPLTIDIGENPVLNALDLSGVPITNSTPPWFHQTATTHDGIDAAQSGDVADNQSSWFEIDVTGPETVLFWWKVSSEANWDYLRLLVNGSLDRRISGETDWEQIQLPLPAGNHTIRWEYDKDGSVSNGSDAGWVDQLSLASQSQIPYITSALTALGGKDQPFSYQIETLSPATSFSSDPLPSGLSLNPVSGLISGTPTAGITTEVSITASNANGSDTQPLRLVIGEVAEFPFFDDFESGVIRPVWTITGTNEFRTQVTESNGPPQSGTWQMLMDDSVDGGLYSRNEATLTVNLSGQSDVVLSFYARDYSDESDGPPSTPFTGGADFDGVAISEDGIDWYEIQGLREEIDGDWEKFQIDLDAALAAHGLAYNSTFRIRFNQFDNFSATTDGIGIDDVSVGKFTATPDLTEDSDTGVSNTDNLTRDATPNFDTTGIPGSVITLSSSNDGVIGSGTIGGTGTATITASPLTEGIHEITAVADGGIPSEPLEIVIDTTGATVAVNQAAGQGNPTSIPIINFSISFDEPAQTFDSGDVSLSGTLASGAAATLTESLPNDGTSFNLEITNFPGDGNISVDIPEGVTTDLAGNPSQASSGTYNLVHYLEPSDPPTGVSASDGEFSNRILVTWELVPNADGGYVIYRNTSSDFGSAAQIVATLPGSTSFSDTSATTETTYHYWVLSRRFNSGVSGESQPDSGFRAADQHGNSPATASGLGELSAGSSTQSGILENQDKDHFEFNLPWRAHVKVYSTGELDTIGTLLADDGTTPLNEPSEDGNARPDGKNFEIEELLDPGDYFLKVEGTGNQSGPYEVVFEIQGPLEFQPDRQIGKKPGSLIGNDYYSASGSGQTQTIVSKKLRAVTFHGRIENDGNFADDLTVRGNRGNRLFRLIYFDESGNTTAGIISGTHVKTYDAGEGENTRIVVKPSRKLKNRRTKKIARKKINALIVVTSGLEGERTDAVRAQAKTR